MSKSDLPPLTGAQREIMEIVWERGEVTVSEVREALARKRQLARNTIQTMIVRLEERGMAQAPRGGSDVCLLGKPSANHVIGRQVAQLIDRFFAGSTEEMVTALLEYRGLTRDEAERIRGMIKTAENESKKNQSQGD